MGGGIIQNNFAKLDNNIQELVMKKLSKVVVGLLLVSSCSFASTMSQNDKDMIFKNQNVNFELLSNQEMKETEGEWWHIALALAYTTQYYANAPTIGGKIYANQPKRIFKRR